MFYLFRGENFGFTNNELHLDGGNKGFRKIGFTEIAKIKICKGFVTSNPILTLSFGIFFLFIVIIGVDWATDELAFAEINRLSNYSIRGFGAMLTGIGLFLIMGGMYISLITPNKIVLKVETISGSVEVRSLKVLEKKSGLNGLIDFLVKNFPPQKFNVDTKILAQIASQNER